jgi:peroxiredoxin
LYQIIESNQNTKGKIKLIGIGAGNSPFEVNYFRETYKIPFPLFDDKNYDIHEMLGMVRTPYFFVVKINKDGTHKLTYSQLGAFKTAEEFLDLILKESGLK